ncbi:MAG TPA: NAD-dependent epimerase/dehydratase family protein [Polyangiaceae bacterium]|jgi:dihydroflavonol-4-reductase
MKSSWTLVTGAGGFVGAAVVRRLLERGERVRAFVRPEANLDALRELSSERLTLSVGDVRIEHTVFRALAGCRRMFHVAHDYSFDPRSREDVLSTAITGTRAVLEAARRRRLQKIVVTGCAAALGVNSEPEPMDEGHAFNLTDPDAHVEAEYEASQVTLDAIEDGRPVVTVFPTVVLGPGDRKPTPTGAGLVGYLGLSPNLRVPVGQGGLNVVDVEDVAEGHVLAMERGSVGERYLLGGENLTYVQLFELLSELTGLALPGKPQSPRTAAWLATVLELKARLAGRRPLVTRKLVRDFGSSFAWFTSKKAEQELGYRHRPASEAIARSVRWFLKSGQVPEEAVRRVRLELRPA